MTVNNRVVHPDRHTAAVMQGGRWIACAGFTYVVAWLVGLAIGLTTSSPGPTDSVSTIGAYFSSHREVAMIQAYLLDGIAGASLIVFAAALRSALRRFESCRRSLTAMIEYARKWRVFLE